MDSETRPGRRGRSARCRDTSRSAGGLRLFSMKVVDKIKSRMKTTYNAVANELVADLNISGSTAKDGKSIRRRCYDAINVLLACGLIRRDDKKQIIWRGHGSVEVDRLRTEVEQKKEEVEKKRTLLMDYERRHKALEALLERSAARQQQQTDSPETGSSGAASSSACSRSSQHGRRIMLPFVLVQARAGSGVQVRTSEDQQNVEFELDEPRSSFTRLPLDVHDDCTVVLQLQQHEAELQAQHHSRRSPATPPEEGPGAPPACGEAPTPVPATQQRQAPPAGRPQPPQPPLPQPPPQLKQQQLQPQHAQAQQQQVKRQDQGVHVKQEQQEPTRQGALGALPGPYEQRQQQQQQHPQQHFAGRDEKQGLMLREQQPQHSFEHQPTLHLQAARGMPTTARSAQQPPSRQQHLSLQQQQQPPQQPQQQPRNPSTLLAPPGSALAPSRGSLPSWLPDPSSDTGLSIKSDISELCLPQSRSTAPSGDLVPTLPSRAATTSTATATTATTTTRWMPPPLSATPAQLPPLVPSQMPQSLVSGDMPLCSSGQMSGMFGLPAFPQPQQPPQQQQPSTLRLAAPATGYAALASQNNFPQPYSGGGALHLPSTNSGPAGFGGLLAQEVLPPQQQLSHHPHHHQQQQQPQSSLLQSEPPLFPPQALLPQQQQQNHQQQQLPFMLQAQQQQHLSVPSHPSQSHLQQQQAQQQQLLNPQHMYQQSAAYLQQQQQHHHHLNLQLSHHHHHHHPYFQQQTAQPQPLSTTATGYSHGPYALQPHHHLPPGAQPLPSLSPSKQVLAQNNLQHHPHGGPGPAPMVHPHQQPWSWSPEQQLLVEEDLCQLAAIMPYSADDPDPLGFGVGCPALAVDQLGYMGWPYRTE